MEVAPCDTLWGVTVGVLDLVTVPGKEKDWVVDSKEQVPLGAAVTEAVGADGVEVPVAERLCRNDWESLGVEVHVADRDSDFQGLRVGVPDRLAVPQKVCEWVRDAPGV